MFNRRDLPECRHAVGSLVGSEVTVVSAASVCYSFLLVPPAKGPCTPPTSIGWQRRTAVHPVSFTGRPTRSMKRRFCLAAWHLLYRTVAVERHFSHICHTRDPSAVAASQPTDPHQLDQIKLQRDNMSINQRVGYWFSKDVNVREKVRWRLCLSACVRPTMKNFIQEMTH